MNDQQQPPNTGAVSPIKIPADILAKIDQTVRQQAAEDALGAEAARAALPGPTRDIWSPSPDITVGIYKVRRFVDRDFMLLDAIGHPLKSFSAMSDGSYDYIPSGPLAHQLCWLMTHPIQECKQAVKGGVDKFKEDASDQFGELPLQAIAAIMTAIAEQMSLYAAAHINYKAKEGEHGSPPSSPQPSTTG